MNALAASQLVCSVAIVHRGSRMGIPGAAGTLFLPPFGILIPRDNLSFHPLVPHIIPALASEEQCLLAVAPSAGLDEDNFLPSTKQLLW